MSFDFVWIVTFLSNNIHWFFALFMFVVIAHNGKRPIWHFLVIVALLWALVDIENFMHLAFVSIIVFVPVDWTIRLFLENTSLEKHELKIIVFVFLALTFINTFYFNLVEVL